MLAFHTHLTTPRRPQAEPETLRAGSPPEVVVFVVAFIETLAEEESLGVVAVAVSGADRLMDGGLDRLIGAVEKTVAVALFVTASGIVLAASPELLYLAGVILEEVGVLGGEAAHRARGRGGEDDLVRHTYMLSRHSTGPKDFFERLWRPRGLTTYASMPPAAPPPPRASWSFLHASAPPPRDDEPEGAWARGDYPGILSVIAMKSSPAPTAQTMQKASANVSSAHLMRSLVGGFR